ncbi:MAG: SDR family NAD(P)-dependent oxidoreductase [Flavobacteriia bacterium]|jgi:benzil reductase ((S)-benzoin forming)
MYVYITGVSRGLGFALAENFLNHGNFVFGIGRTNSIENEKYNFIECDLSDNNEVDSLQINLPENEEILLINNAGILGDVKRVSDQEVDFSQSLFQTNTISPIQLCRKFSRWCEEKNCKLTIINISSGAGRRAIPSWANYCASKAALDLFSETFQLEEIEKGKETRIFSLAPGVIDTEMQINIRNTEKSNFSSQESFELLKAENKLQSPADTASKIRIFSLNCEHQNVICRLD